MVLFVTVNSSNLKGVQTRWLTNKVVPGMLQQDCQCFNSRNLHFCSSINNLSLS